MRLTLTLLFYVCLLLCAARARAKEWEGIVPLHSTRADVERLLGKPVDEGNNISTYRMKDDVVIVFYATGEPCERGTIQSGWMVPRDTVVQIIINTPNWFPFSTLKIDRSKYKETTGWHVPNTSYFTDDEEGVMYVVQTVVMPEMVDGQRELRERPGMVTSITYSPAAKDKHLQCPPPPQARRTPDCPPSKRTYQKQWRLPER